MQESGKYRVHVCGNTYTIASTESETYIRELEGQLNSQIEELMTRRQGISVNDALVLIALNLLDSLQKSEAAADHLRNQLSEYLEDAARARMQVDEAKRQIEHLSKELTIRSQQVETMLME